MLVEGLLKINGNYIMDGKDLVVALVDWDDNGVFDTNTGYGKLEVMGTADISKGYLKVRIDDFVKEIASDSVWRGVVITGTLNGEFVSATDNSPLVDFYANYNDGSRVHL